MLPLKHAKERCRKRVARSSYVMIFLLADVISNKQQTQQQQQQHLPQKMTNILFIFFGTTTVCFAEPFFLFLSQCIHEYTRVRTMGTISWSLCLICIRFINIKKIGKCIRVRFEYVGNHILTRIPCINTLPRNLTLSTSKTTAARDSRVSDNYALHNLHLRRTVTA